MKLVIIESPYAGDVEANLRYARACLKDSLLRNEAPFASHLLYTQEGVLDDSDPNERARGILAGFQWGKKADLVAVYQDYGISQGMEQGIKAAQYNGIPVEYRHLL
jgi:hypothetical protein